MTTKVEARTDEGQLYTRSQAAAYLGVAVNTIYRWGRTNRIGIVTMPSGQSRYRKSELDAIKSGRHGRHKPRKMYE